MSCLVARGKNLEHLRKTREARPRQGCPRHILRTAPGNIGLGHGAADIPPKHCTAHWFTLVHLPCRSCETSSRLKQVLPLQVVVAPHTWTPRFRNPPRPGARRGAPPPGALPIQRDRATDPCRSPHSMLRMGPPNRT